MFRHLSLTLNLFLAASLYIVLTSPSYAQKDPEKEFIKKHQEEMTSFMEKCSACHSLQRVFGKQRSKEEWEKILNQMAGKPHSMISEEDVKRIQKWIDLMESAFTVGP